MRQILIYGMMSFWKYLSFINPSLAIQLHDSFPERSLKFGISDAQTYYWIHNMNALGNVRSDVTSDHPIALSFIKDGQPTYIAHNYSNNPLSVTFSDGFELFIEPRSMGTNRGSDITGEISSEFYQAYMNGSIQLDVTSEIQNITRVEFFNGPELVGEDISFPYSFLASNLPVGMHDFYGKIYSGLDFGLTNIINIQVGEQLPYEESVVNIPGTIEPGQFDFFQGGVGQNISYFDNTISNNGSYRLDEYVDVEYFGETEGPTLGWIESGEWVEYTIHVEEPGFYDLEYRFASDLPSGVALFIWNLMEFK